MTSLGGGKFKTKEQVEAMEKAGDKGRTFGDAIKSKLYFFTDCKYTVEWI